jgi:hypothetical protein
LTDCALRRRCDDGSIEQRRRNRMALYIPSNKMAPRRHNRKTKPERKAASAAAWTIGKAFDKAFAEWMATTPGTPAAAAAAEKMRNTSQA